MSNTFWTRLFLTHTFKNNKKFYCKKKRVWARLWCIHTRCYWPLMTNSALHTSGELGHLLRYPRSFILTLLVDFLPSFRLIVCQLYRKNTHVLGLPVPMATFLVYSYSRFRAQDVWTSLHRWVTQFWTQQCSFFFDPLVRKNCFLPCNLVTKLLD